MEPENQEKLEPSKENSENNNTNNEIKTESKSTETKKKKDKKKKIKYNKIRILFLILFIFAIIGLAYYFYCQSKDKNSIKEIQESMDIQEGEIPTKIDKIKELQAINPDIKGWITIDNTIINYPILQTENNDFYLTHDYKKEENKYGSIYLKNSCNLNDNNSNLILYGHNMMDEEMFNSLLKYQDKAFYDEHKTVNITTENEERKYEIVTAFKSRVFYKNEKNVFRYYNCLNFKDENEYNNYINNAKKIQLYDTGVTANFGEQLLTMITCEYSQENGRMVVIAKRINT